MPTLYQGEPSGSFQSQLKPMHNNRWRLACSTKAGSGIDLFHRVLLLANCCQPEKLSDCVLGKVGDAVRSSQGGGVGDVPLTQEQLSAVAAGADHPHLPCSQQDDSAADRSLQGPAYQRQGSSRKRKHGSPAPESPKAAGAAAQAAPKEVSSPQPEDV